MICAHRSQKFTVGRLWQTNSLTHCDSMLCYTTQHVYKASVLSSFVNVRTFQRAPLGNQESTEPFNILPANANQNTNQGASDCRHSYTGTHPHLHHHPAPLAPDNSG